MATYLDGRDADCLPHLPGLQMVLGAGQVEAEDLSDEVYGGAPTLSWCELMQPTAVGRELAWQPVLACRQTSVEIAGMLIATLQRAARETGLEAALLAATDQAHALYATEA